MVGTFETERLMGGVWTPADLREHGQYAASGRAARVGVAWPALTDTDVARVRAMRAELFERWAAIEPGQTLVLHFRCHGGAKKCGRARS